MSALTIYIKAQTLPKNKIVYGSRKLQLAFNDKFRRYNSSKANCGCWFSTKHTIVSQEVQNIVLQVQLNSSSNLIPPLVKPSRLSVILNSNK